MTTSEEVTIAAERDQFIPVRKTDILDALVDHGDLRAEAERAEFRQVCRMLAAIYHYEYFEHLEKLRELYFYFNPDVGPTGRLDKAALERSIEEWLRKVFDLDLEFEVEDALAKLERLGLLRRAGERLSAPPPDQTLKRLDAVWDNYFQFDKAAAVASA